jgi:hypothetical protein
MLESHSFGAMANFWVQQSSETRPDLTDSHDWQRRLQEEDVAVRIRPCSVTHPGELNVFSHM